VEQGREASQKKALVQIRSFVEPLVQRSVEPDFFPKQNRSDRSTTTGNCTLLKAFVAAKTYQRFNDKTRWP